MATNDPYISESSDGSDTTHNYVLISVPHGADTFYYKSSATEQPMTSFLRIGAVSGDDPTKEGGWDFAKLVVGFNDDTRTRPGDDQQSSGTVAQAVGESSVAADVKEGMKAFYGGDTSLSADQLARVKESMKLHYRGGWRDHSAGNRISTTQGDKVELVRGNYKMVVMGRRPDEEDAKGDALKYGDYAVTPVDTVDNAISTTDVSGGHVMDWNMSPGQITEITWVKTDTGRAAGKGVGGDSSAAPPDTPSAYYTWKTLEETVKGDVDTTYYGNVTESYFGPTVSTQIGWEKAPHEDDGNRSADDDSVPRLFRDYPNLNRENPVVTERTWAKEIETYRGSNNHYVERIKELTYADRISTETHTAYMKIETRARKYYEDIYSDYHSTTFYGGDFREMWNGHFGELFLGEYESLKVGYEFTDFRAAFRIIEVNAAIGITDIKLGAAVNELCVAIEKDSVFWGSQHNEFVLAGKRMTYTTGLEVQFATVHQVCAAIAFIV